MIRILGDQHVRQQAGPRHTFFDGAMRRGFLHDA
jgi:hypothetical protein